jgi:hypothetical protein
MYRMNRCRITIATLVFVECIRNMAAELSLSRGINGFIAPFLTKPRVDLIIEIGSYRGATTNLLCERYLTEGGKVIAVDPLVDGVYVPIDASAHKDLKRIHKESWHSRFSKQYDYFVRNTNRNASRIELVRKTSNLAFPELLERFEGTVDLIYVDGDHRAETVWEDAINSFRLCCVGGLIVFDDYLWRKGELPPELTPMPAIDRFLKEYAGRVRVMKKGYRVAVRKIAM